MRLLSPSTISMLMSENGRVPPVESSCSECAICLKVVNKSKSELFLQFVSEAHEGLFAPYDDVNVVDIASVVDSLVPRHCRTLF